MGLIPFPTVPPSLLRPMRRSFSLLLSSLLALGALLVAPQASWAYPFWAQQNYAYPREATGKLACANCHLAKKPTHVELPQAVFPDERCCRFRL